MSEIKDKISSNFISLDQKQKIPAKENRDPKMLEAARMFENQFLRQMISQMRKTVPESEFMPDSQAQKYFKDQMDDHYAENWTQNGGIGLADVIYKQLQDRIDAKRPKPAVKQSGDFMALPEIKSEIKIENKKEVYDLISKRDKDLFLLKKTNHGLFIKSRDPLPEHVDIKAPMGGKVLQAQELGEGKQMLIIGHDLGLKTQYVHTGQNLVESGQELIAGQALARLPASRQGEHAHVVFGLRDEVSIE